MDWSNAGKRTKIWLFDGSVMAPMVLCLVVFHVGTIVFLLVYAAVSAYITFRGRSMTWVLRRARFFLRDGVVLARPANYWRRLIG